MPKRDRVSGHLLGLIEAGRPGEAVPSERVLSAALGVSRPTVRAAVDELVRTGQLVRQHGRGMFIAPAKITQELVSDDAAQAVPRASGLWTSRILELQVIHAGARIGRKLRLSPAASVKYIARARYVDGEPMAIEHLHIPADLVPGLTHEELEAGELYDHLREHHGVHVQEAVQSIEPTVVDEEEAEVLAVPVLSAALRIERLTTDRTGRPVEYVHSLYRGDRYRMVSRLSLGDPPAPGGPARAGGGRTTVSPDDFAGHGVFGLVTGDVQEAR
ncbi:GntR family transcriptional regulator [Streptomyces sp. NPDC060194]|uniref:GntR family transcriptional regulator n=1 Tax=Streptomyces sp. NPDC060194 TaxID=3347069 RepID=UPI0036469735